MTPPTTTTLDVREDAAVLHVTFDRPDARNAIDATMTAELQAVLAYAAARRGTLRAVVLRGTGGTFCAGGDLKEFAAAFAADPPDRAAIAGINAGAGRFLEQLVELPQVTVAAVDGAAMGAGVALAAAADVCLTTAAARFTTTETSLGLVPAQIAPFLVRRIGLVATRRLTVTAARIDGAEAVRIGLADEVVADDAALDDAVGRVLDGVRRCAPHANAATKELIDEAVWQPLADYRDHAATRFVDALLGPEAQEGITAFLEARRPAWRDA